MSDLIGLHLLVNWLLHTIPQGESFCCRSFCRVTVFNDALDRLFLFIKILLNSGPPVPFLKNAGENKYNQGRFNHLFNCIRLNKLTKKMISYYLTKILQLLLHRQVTKPVGFHVSYYLCGCSCEYFFIQSTTYSMSPPTRHNSFHLIILYIYRVLFIFGLPARFWMDLCETPPERNIFLVSTPWRQSSLLYMYLPIKRNSNIIYIIIWHT